MDHTLFFLVEKLFDCNLDEFICVGKMIGIFKVKEKQRELSKNSNGKPPGKKQSAGELRLNKGTLHY